MFDSATELTGARDHEGARQLTFRAPGLEIEVMVADPATRRLVGQLVPAEAATVRLEGTDGSSSRTPIASDGSRSTAPRGTSAVRITVTPRPKDAAVQPTDWVLL